MIYTINLRTAWHTQKKKTGITYDVYMILYPILCVLNKEVKNKIYTRYSYLVWYFEETGDTCYTYICTPACIWTGLERHTHTRQTDDVDIATTCCPSALIAKITHRGPKGKLVALQGNHQFGYSRYIHTCLSPRKRGRLRTDRQHPKRFFFLHSTK